jgi:hypothetical protein
MIRHLATRMSSERPQAVLAALVAVAVIGAGLAVAGALSLMLAP